MQGCDSAGQTWGNPLSPAQEWRDAQAMALGACQVGEDVRFMSGILIT
jgi:hypothetical protein